MISLSSKANQKVMEHALFCLVVVALINILGFSYRQIEHLCIIVSFVLLTILALYSQLLTNSLFLVIFMLNIFSVVFTIYLYGGEATVLNLFNILFALLVLSNTQINITIYRRIHLLSAVILSFYILTTDLSTIDFAYCYSLFGGRLNSNSYGILTLANYYCWTCYLSTYKKRKALLIFANAGILLVSVYLLFISGCRTTIGAIAVFLFLGLIRKKSIPYRQFRCIIILIILMNLVLVPLYINLADNNIDVVLFGKSLFSGREYVWKSAWNHFLNSPWIGNGGSISLVGPRNTTTVSAHNTLLNILYTLGVIPAASFIFMLGRRLPERRHYTYNRIAQLAFLSSLVLSFFESFYTDSHFFVFYLILLLPVQTEVERLY